MNYEQFTDDANKDKLKGVRLFCQKLLEMITGGVVSNEFPGMNSEYKDFLKTNKFLELSRNELTHLFRIFGIEGKTVAGKYITIVEKPNLTKLIDALKEKESSRSYSIISIDNKKYYLTTTLQPIEDNKPLWSKEAKGGLLKHRNI